MKSFLVFLSCIIFCVNATAQQSDQSDQLAIREVLLQQVQAWNHGNLKDYMSGYWKSDSLQFIGKNGITHGWQNTLENYQKSYSSKEAMGILAFTQLSLKKISDEYYFVTGHWHLTRTAGDLQGWFSLLFKKIDNHWRIVADHSS